ncbi:16482_t:CDS:2 [Entrophospora sp. SA101]|nr:100_t:CDS:2 [Entrophospora sp. SA101]CAJ0761232.1 16482_t:CDS:2 [Entrophospora sp. SA101]CAJ0830066.1 11793_t:CDS:2 [Entrophospora sp. SA101]CAJ0912291.1 9081_t:CDS:2 [Entrophospora sp. SA101]
MTPTLTTINPEQLEKLVSALNNISKRLENIEKALAGIDKSITLQFLEQIPQRILNLPNQRKESKRKEHYGLFLLCQKAGLRVSEAVNFDLNKKTRKGLYLIKSKGKKKRYVYIPKKKIKRELNIPPDTELTPHTLRRAFATYQAEAGLPLPLLSKLLGAILAGKNWLEKPKKPQPEPKQIKINLEKLSEPLTPDLPLFSPSQAEHLSKINHLEEKLSQIQRKNNNLEKQNADLRQDLNNLSEQNTNLQQQLTNTTAEKQQIQQKLTQAQEKIS